jgi:hypothetical protein
MSIPASTIVSVVPSVLAAGGNPLALNGLFLSANNALPIGAPISFPSLATVQAYFGQYSTTFTATVAATAMSVSAIASGGPLQVGQYIQGTLATGALPGAYIAAVTNSGVAPCTVTLSGAGWTQATAMTYTANELESQMAAVYFNGCTSSTIKPTALLMARYVTAGGSVGSTYLGSAAWLRGAAVTLAAVQGVTSGTIALTINGLLCTSSALNLSSASSLSNAASLIQTAFSSAFIGAALGTTVSWNGLAGGFVIQSAANVTITTCAGTSITAATGTPAAVLGLTAAQATISAGSAVSVPGTFMSALILQTTNWAGFSTCFEPSATDKALFSAWNSGTGGQFAYVPYDSDTTIVSTNASTTCISRVASLNNYGGTCAVYQDPNAAAFVLGWIASINFNAVAGSSAIAYKSGTGITPSITDPTSFANAIANETNFYGQWATANSTFTLFYNGNISGPFNWIDSYVNAIWLNSALQLALINTFQVMNTIPYTNAGYATIRAACKSTLDLALANGVIDRGVALTSTQANAVDTASGLIIDPVLATTGYYLLVLPATGTQRANRTSPPCTLWYMDGGSVNQLNLASIDVQ